MASILNPTEFLVLDIMYYFFVVFLGPALLVFNLIYQPKKRSLHDAYLNSGVNCLGIITHCRIIIHRGSVTRIERYREYKIRYAYKVPGTNTIIFKDYVHVKKEQLERRLFAAVVLPGQPNSGVRRFLLQERRPWYIVVPIYLLSIFVTLFSIYLFSILYALFVVKKCIGRTCYVGMGAVALSIISMAALGFVFAWFMYKAELRSVPGSVYMRQELEESSSNEHEVVTVEERRALYERLDERQVPTAEVVTVLNADDATLTQAAEDAGVAMAHPVDLVLEEEEAKSKDDDSVSEARVIEII